VGKPERLVADVGLKIAELRRKAGLTQEELAAKLGVTARYVARLRWHSPGGINRATACGTG
jgi:ribosome-binding protein aMBF1 (putative translation factor)